MNKIAEYGVAAHSIYKDMGVKPNGAGHQISRDTNAYAWLRRTIEQLAEGDSPEDFLENTKLELFQDQVFCFTPKGRLIALPKGATPIDFAYAVHTEVGDSCVGAKINGRIMPVMTELKNGDEVEIIRSKAQVPPAAWESIAVTGKARAAIRRATKNAIRKQYSGLGSRILERAFERAGKPFSKDSLKTALPRLAHKDAEDVLAAVGRGEISSTDVVKAVYPDYKDERVTQAPKPREEGWSKIRNAAGMLFQLPGRASRKERAEDKSDALPIRGVSGDLPVKFAPEGAVPGDRIVGIVQPGSGITIYPIQSPSLTAFDDQPERWIDVRWDIDEDTKERFPARISVTAINAPGSLAEIAQIVASNDANIHTLSMVRTAPDFTEMLVDLEVWDLKHLNRLISQLKASTAVSDVRRVNG
jgi:guanosine-3',5'-bis(diphosphate) 3'-pyrophosphohydrolase